MESTLRGGVPVGTRLIETFRWTPDVGFVRLELHLARMARSAGQLGFRFKAAEARACLKAQGSEPLRCRLTLGHSGFEFGSAPLAKTPGVWSVGIAETRLESLDPWLLHKSTNRALYDRDRADLPESLDELIYLNEKDEVCEGTITNVFATLQDGRIVTPPTSCGLLPGILRQSLLEEGGVTEATLTLAMLKNAKAVHIGNSLRGLIEARLR